MYWIENNSDKQGGIYNYMVGITHQSLHNQIRYKYPGHWCQKLLRIMIGYKDFFECINWWVFPSKKLLFGSFEGRGWEMKRKEFAPFHYFNGDSLFTKFFAYLYFRLIFMLVYFNTEDYEGEQGNESIQAEKASQMRVREVIKFLRFNNDLIYIVRT